MGYTVGKFAKLLGQSTDILRYYEKTGLLLPDRDPDNDYRMFSESHALQVMNLRMYRSLDLTLGEMKDIARGLSVREQNLALMRKREHLAAEIRRLERQAKRIDELKVFYDLAERDTGRAGEIDMEASYCLFVFGKGARRTPQALRLMRLWMRHLPYTFFSVGASLESLLSEDEDLDMRLGIGVLERYRKEFDLPLCPDVETFPRGKSVYLHLVSPDPLGLTKRDLAPLYGYVKERGYRIISGATGRTFAAETADGSPRYFFSLRVLVE